MYNSPFACACSMNGARVVVRPGTYFFTVYR